MMLEKLARYAMRVARSMTSDPEAESIANETALRAFRTYDPNKGLSIERWVAFCVKIDVWHLWRGKAHRCEELRSELFWEAVEAPAREPDRENVSDADWALLAERYIDGVYLDVMARRRSVSVAEVRKRLRAAESRFIEAMS